MRLTVRWERTAPAITGRDRKAKGALVLSIALAIMAVGMVPARAQQSEASDDGAGTVRAAATSSPPAASPAGYWLLGADGGVFSLGGVGYHGSAANLALAAPIVGGAPAGLGYWLVAGDGGVFAYGAAIFHGSTGGMRLNGPVVGMAASPKGGGYWLVARDGGVFAFGSAIFHGSTGGMRLNAPIVGMAPTASGLGYWLFAEDGGVFTFGDAGFHGSAGDIELRGPIVGGDVTAGDLGYRLLGRDGGVFTFGQAPFLGTPVGQTSAALVDLATAGAGYLIAGDDGGVHAYGTPFHGWVAGLGLNAPVVAVLPGTGVADPPAAGVPPADPTPDPTPTPMPSDPAPADPGDSPASDGWNGPYLQDDGTTTTIYSASELRQRYRRPFAATLLDSVPCRAAQPTTAPPFAEALAAARAIVGEDALADAAATVANGAEASARGLSGLASRQAGEALGWLLVAQHLAPGEPGHLLGLSGVLVTIDQPLLALSFLDQYATLGRTPAPAMGMVPAAVAATNRGMALAALGQYASAASLFTQAQALDPALAEATTGLAVALKCTQGSAVAVDEAQRRRENLEYDPRATAEPEDEVVEEYVALAQRLDVDGPSLELPPVPIADSYKHLVAYHDFGLEQYAALTDWSQQQASRPPFTVTASTEAGAQRLREVESLLTSLRRQPDVKPHVAAELAAADDALSRHAYRTEELWGAVDDDTDGKSGEWSAATQAYAAGLAVCDPSSDSYNQEQCRVEASRYMSDLCRPWFSSAYTAWTLERVALEDAVRARLGAESSRGLGLLAHVDDPAFIDHWRQQIVDGLVIDWYGLLDVYGLPSDAWLMTGLGCDLTGEIFGEEYNAPTITPIAPDAQEAPAVTACTEQVAKLSGSVAFGPLSLEMSCESVTVSASSLFFASVNVPFAEGAHVTIYAGAGLEARAPGPAPIGGSIKAGLYLEVGKDGIYDFGSRVTGDVSLGSGGLSVLDEKLSWVAVATPSHPIYRF